MEQEQALRKYIRPAVWPVIVTCVLLAAFALSAVMAAVTGKAADPSEAREYFPSEVETGAYVYVDVVGVSDWVCQNGDYTYYTLLDADGYSYTARMSKSEFLELKIYNDWWNEEDASVPAPQPRRVTGVARIPGDEVASLAAQAWGMDGTSEYYRLFGTTYIDVGSTPAGEHQARWILAAMFTFLSGLLFLRLWAPAACRAGKCIKRLEEQGWMEAAAAQFAESKSCEPDRDRVRLTEHFMFGKGTGTAVACADLLWCYRKVTRYNFVTVGEELLLFTAWAKNLRLVNKKYSEQSAGEDIIDFLLRVVHTQNPFTIIGFSGENAKEYKAARKGAQPQRQG